MKTLIVVVVVVIAGLAYWLLSRKKETAPFEEMPPAIVTSKEETMIVKTEPEISRGTLMETIVESEVKQQAQVQAVLVAAAAVGAETTQEVLIEYEQYRATIPGLPTPSTPENWTGFYPTEDTIRWLEGGGRP